MTNQQLKAHCEDVIANPQAHPDWVVDMARVALASLEAVPVAYRLSMISARYDEHWYYSYSESNDGHARKEPLFIAPPVPEMKLPDVSDGDPGKLHDVRTRHDFSNGFRFAIEEVKRLNGVTS